MKLSKSFIIFVFVLSVSSTFSWTVVKTKGDLLKSLQFTMYCLSIKFNLIGPNLVMTLDHHEKNHQLLRETTITRILPYYNPHISALDDEYYGRSSLYMDKINQGELQHYVLYHSRSVVKDIRVGDRLRDAAERLVRKIVRQRLRMKGLGKTTLPIVDLRKLNPNERVDYKENVIDAIGHQKHLVFINEETKI